MTTGTHMLGHTAKYRNTHYEVQWRLRSEQVEQVEHCKTEAEARLKALKICLEHELAWNTKVEVFEVVFFEELLGTYTKDSATQMLTLPRQGMPEPEPMPDIAPEPDLSPTPTLSPPSTDLDAEIPF